MKKTLGILTLALVLIPAVANAAAGDWLVRLRAVRIDPADQSDAIPALGVPADAITVSEKTIPEVDITYFFTEHIATELILTYPQKHDVAVLGTKIGTFKHLPPVLSAQYHFAPDAVFSPYVGAGVNFTLISNVDLAVPGVGKLDLSSTSVGLAGQAGFDVKLGEKLSLNADVKYVQLDADVKLKANGAKVSNVGVNPWLFGVGIGYRF